MTVDVIQFMPGHLDFMDLKDCHGGESVVSSFHNLFGASGAHLKTLVHDGKPIAVIGLLHHRQGVAECIMGCTELVKTCPFAFVNTIRALHDEYVEKLGLRRVHITIRSGHKELEKWAKFLGFEEEGLMKKYGSQGDDYHMYARVYGR
jgi:hypothetical protein